MSDGTHSNDQAQALAQMLAQATQQLQAQQQAQQQAPGVMPVAAMQPAMMQPTMGPVPVSQMATAQPTGISLQIKIATSQGSLRAYVHFGPEMASPQVLMAALPQISQLFPLDFWRPKNNSWGGNSQRGGGW